MKRFTLAIAIPTALALTGVAYASNNPAMDAVVQHINDQWAHIRYQVTSRDEQYRQLDKLAGQAAQVVARYPGRAEPLLWQGIVVSEEAARASVLNSSASPGRPARSWRKHRQSTRTSPMAG